MPSRILNSLLSVPFAWTSTLPSVSTPSTSKRITLIGRAFASTVTLEHLRTPQVGEVHDTGDAAAVDDDDRRDLALLHDAKRLDRQSRRRDRHRAARHDVAGAQVEYPRFAVHVPPQVA